MSPHFPVACLALLLAAGPGCAPTPPPDVEAVVVEAEPVSEAEPVTEAEIAPATLDEIRAICRVYRRATYGRWDDQRTRGELGGLDLTSDMAAGWQTRLSTSDPADALDATRAVLDAAHEAGVASACQPLEGLVAVAAGLAGPPAEESAPAEADAGSP